MAVLPKAERKALAIHAALILAPGTLALGYMMLIGGGLTLTTLLALFLLTESQRPWWTFPLIAYLSGRPLPTVIAHSWLPLKGAATRA